MALMRFCETTLSAFSRPVADDAATCFDTVTASPAKSNVCVTVRFAVGTELFDRDDNDDDCVGGGVVERALLVDRGVLALFDAALEPVVAPLFIC